MQEPIMDKVQEVFRGVFADPQLEISTATNASHISAWDSLKHINLMVAIERAFKIRLALGEVDKLKNVGDLVEVIEKRVSNQLS